MARIYLLSLLLLSCSKVKELPTVKVKRLTVQETVSSVTSGTVRAERETELAFGAVGRVSQLNVKVGSIVKARDILAEIENIDLARVKEVAQRNLTRAQSLSSANLLSSQELDQAREIAAQALTAYEKSIIRAPFDGIITEVNLEIGKLSQITAVMPKALLRIVDSAPRYISTDIDEVDMPKISAGLSARVRILAVRREPFKATVRLVVPFVNSEREQDRTSLIELDLESGSALIPPGASADVEIITASHENVTALPTKAILGKVNQRYVFREENSLARKVEVKTGISSYEVTEIIAGLNEGDVVLIPSDTLSLSDGDPVVSSLEP